MTSVVLVDSHPFVRKAVRSLLESQNDLVVIGEAADSFEGVKLIQRLKPDVAVLDPAMPVVSSEQAIHLIATGSPATRIVVYTFQSQKVYVEHALKAGAHAYVVKGSASDELVKAIRPSLRAIYAG